MLKKIIPYLSLFLFLFVNPVLNLLSPDDLDKVKYEALQLENASLKNEIKELSHISYTNYDYQIAKILVKNLYNTNTYILQSDDLIAPKHPVINSSGLIGITNQDSTLVPLRDLTISIKVGDFQGVLQNNQVFLDSGELLSSDEEVYTSGLTNFPANLKVGTIKSCKLSDNGTVCTFQENLIDTTYCLILKEYFI